MDFSNLTGNFSLEIRMGFTVALLNDVMKPSLFYDSRRNPNYVIGKPFPFPETYPWLDQHTKQLDLLHDSGPGDHVMEDDLVKCEKNCQDKLNSFQNRSLLSTMSVPSSEKSYQDDC